MTHSLLKNLVEEKVILLDRSKRDKLPFPLEGIIRLVDDKGTTLALLLDKYIMEEIEEDMEATNHGFLASLDKSRRSGRVVGEAVKAEAGLV